MPTKLASDQIRKEQQALLGPLGIVGLNSSKKTQTTVESLTNEEIFAPGHALESDAVKGNNTLMVGLEDQHHDQGNQGETREELLAKIIEKGQYPAARPGRKNPTLYLAVPNITDKEAESIAKNTNREVCYSGADVALRIDSRGDIHMESNTEGALAFMRPSLQKIPVRGKSVYYPRDIKSNQRIDTAKIAPSEREREGAQSKLEITADGAFEVIATMKDKNDPSHIMHSSHSDSDGGGHLRVERSSGERTTVLDIHGLGPNPSSKRELQYNEARITEIIDYLKLPPGKGKAPLAVLSGCNIPNDVAARISEEIKRPLVVGNESIVMIMILKDKGKPSGDVQLFCKDGFSRFNLDGSIQKMNSNFVLLPRTPAISQKVEQQQKMAAFTRSTVSQVKTVPVDTKNALLTEFNTLKSNYNTSKKAINKKYFNPIKKRREIRVATEQYQTDKSKLLGKALRLGFVLHPSEQGFVPKERRTPSQGPAAAPHRPSRGQRR